MIEADDRRFGLTVCGLTLKKSFRLAVHDVIVGGADDLYAL